MRLYPPIPLIKYPRMSPHDIPIWTRYLSKYGKDYSSIAYDVPVGQGIIAPGDVPEYLRADYQQLTQKRIDAVGFAIDHIDIIEVKPRAATTALGQVLTYLTLYQSQEKPTLPLRPVVITDTIAQDDLNVYIQHNITLIVV